METEAERIRRYVEELKQTTITLTDDQKSELGRIFWGREVQPTRQAC